MFNRNHLNRNARNGTIQKRQNAKQQRHRQVFFSKWRKKIPWWKKGIKLNDNESLSDHRVQKLEGSRRRKTSPKNRTATVREHHFAYLKCHRDSTHSNFYPGGCVSEPCVIFKRYPGGAYILSVSVGYIIPTGCFRFLFLKLYLGVSLFLNFVLAKRWGAVTCPPRAQPSFMISLLLFIMTSVWSQKNQRRKLGDWILCRPA